MEGGRIDPSGRGIGEPVGGKSDRVFGQQLQPDPGGSGVSCPHGKNGEDGTLQGMFELAGIPVVGCNTLSSALCMDKERAHRIVRQAGIPVPQSVTFRESEKEEAVL